MYYNYYKPAPCEYDELFSRGAYSVNPSLSSLQEVILIYLKELAYYILQLKGLGANNEVIKESIIEAILGIVTNVDYNQQQFQKIIITLVQDLSQAKVLYAGLCAKNNQKPQFLKTHFKHSKNFDIAEIIRKGELYFIKKNASYTLDQKNLFDVMLSLAKNMCIRIAQIKSYKKDYEAAYNSILILLNTMNFDEVSDIDAKAIIETCSFEYHNLLKDLCIAQEEAHGKRESVYISFAPRNGKAILVSGIDMVQLEDVLKATKNRDVDVYTHGVTMLMAHTLENFRKYPNLVGHFGKGSEASLFDFAAFPGSILTTRYLFQKVEYLYRGRLFTTDTLAPKGVIKIKNGDYEPLIQAAIDSKGFTKKQQKLILRVGFRQKEMEKNVHEIIDKMAKNEIKHLYIIGLLKMENGCKDYFDKFLKLMPKDCYALSLAYDQNEENILHVDSFYDYLFVYKILEQISEKTPLDQLKISMFITRCDQYTISNIINFINLGIKDIYLCKCIPTLVHPALSATMRKTFGVKEMSTPEEDLERTLSE